MKKTIALILICCMTLFFAACGSTNDNEGGSQTETEQASEPTPETETEEATEQTESTEQEEVTETTEDVQTEEDEAAEELITEDQALQAIKNYRYSIDPDLKEMEDSDEYTIGWDVSTNERNDIVVLYRAYTGAEIRYYIDPKTGEAFATELVPGIIDEEQFTEETLNINDYLS